MIANYPLNTWYVAAFGDELGADGVVARRLLGTHVVLYRRSNGTVVALEDRCVHRAYPLSRGHRDGDLLVCGYHGCVYDGEGRLLRVPSQEYAPSNAAVRAYPVREDGAFVWIWLGDARAADLRPVPNSPWNLDAGYADTRETFRVEANYLLLHEHYLDLTNVFLMYPEAAPPGIEALPQLDEVHVSELSVAYARTLPRATLAEWEAEATGLPAETSCDRVEEGAFVSPGLHAQRYVIIPVEGERAYRLVRLQGFTPETDTATHVFLQLARDYETRRGIVADYLRAMFHRMAARDVEVLEAVQSRLDDDLLPRRDVNVKADRAAVRARRIAQSMVEEEAGLPVFD
ncbi:aromatic ring-hydroxylating dioxygenase subunit alpha [Tsukamurella soli]|uniref:Aromatic ring-hydroxylating dioxygenase subunit alpha n=1 Tax=Tsukamurella soli TaxID=644556 RepID=A0ABP8JMH1_9ACTN